MKPIEEWLNQLPDGYRERALSYSERVVCNVSTLLSAISCFVYWSKTAEGVDFWGAVYQHYETNGKTPLPPLPE